MEQKNMIIELEDAERGLNALVGPEFENHRIGQVQGNIQYAIRVLRKQLEREWEIVNKRVNGNVGERSPKTLLVINGENGDPVSYSRHLPKDKATLDIEKEVRAAVKELSLSVDDGEIKDISSDLCRFRPHWVDETYCFTTV